MERGGRLATFWRTLARPDTGLGSSGPGWLKTRRRWGEAGTGIATGPWSRGRSSAARWSLRPCAPGVATRRAHASRTGSARVVTGWVWLKTVVSMVEMPGERP